MADLPKERDSLDELAMLLAIREKVAASVWHDARFRADYGIQSQYNAALSPAESAVVLDLVDTYLAGAAAVAERDRLAEQLRKAQAATRMWAVGECLDILREMWIEAGRQGAAVSYHALVRAFEAFAKSTPAAPAPDPAALGMRCTCDYHVAPQRCRGAANLGPGWYCAEEHEKRLNLDLPLGGGTEEN